MGIIFHPDYTKVKHRPIGDEEVGRLIQEIVDDIKKIYEKTSAETEQLRNEIRGIEHGTWD